MAVRARVRIQRNVNDYRIVVSGSSKRTVDRLTVTTANVGRQIAPRGHTDQSHREGYIPLRRGHRTDRAVKAGPNLYRGRVRVVSPHGIYVHQGTSGPIRASSREWMKWTNVSGPYKGTWMAKEVSGQAANPWLIRAYNRARQLRGELKRVKPMTASPGRQGGGGGDGKVHLMKRGARR